jgi:cation transport regulator ChaB
MHTGDGRLPAIRNPGQQPHSNHDQTQTDVRVGLGAASDLGRSPFKMPSDEEVFFYRDKEKERQLENKKNNTNLKIWDKKTASTQNPLRNFRHFGPPIPKKTDIVDPSKRAQMEKAESSLITEAMNIVLERKKQRDTRRNNSRNKETMTDVVAQKKEIFLVTMTTENIKKERENLSQLIDKRVNALRK